MIDTASDTVSTIGTGQAPMAAAVNEVTNRVYVVNYGSSDVTVIDGAANRPIATIPVGLWPQQIAINARTNTDLRRQHARRQRVGDRRQDQSSEGDGARPAAARGRSPSIRWPTGSMSPTGSAIEVTVIDGRTNRATER